MLEIHMLPAREGDALWVSWGDGRIDHRLIVDMGTQATGVELRQRIEAFPESQRNFELLVITHVDRDHIGGALTCLAEAEPLEGLRISDVWFNGWSHLDGKSTRVGGVAPRGELEAWGPTHGERFSSWLNGQRWNGEFSGGPVCHFRGERPVTKALAGGVEVTVLGPTANRLSEFRPVWKEEIQNALTNERSRQLMPNLEFFGRESPPRLESRIDLDDLAESDIKKDTSKANGSSIALVIEYEGKRILLAGDAYPQDLVESLVEWKGQLPVDFHAVKLSHHGSAKSLTDQFVRAVRTSHWLFSTDGTRYGHPDAAAVARVLRSSTLPPTLCFNVPSKYNRYWDSDDWRTMYGYETCYGTDADGLSISI